MDIRIGTTDIVLSDSESRLLKEIHSGRLRLERFCTDLRSLNTLKHHNLIFLSYGRYRAPRNSADITKCVRSGLTMVRDEELHLSVWGMSAILQLQAIERTARIDDREQSRPNHRSSTASQSVDLLSDSNTKDQPISTPS